MSKKSHFFLLKNLTTYIGCVLVGIVCSTFLNFSVKRDNDILFLILAIFGVLISYLIDYIANSKKLNSQTKGNKSVITYMIIILSFRWYPGLFPKTVIELIFFLTILFLLVIVQRLYIEKNVKKWIR